MNNLKLKNKLSFLVILLVFALPHRIKAQNNSCENPEFFCEDFSASYCFTSGTRTCSLNLWYYFQVTDTITSVTVSSPGSMTGYTCWGPIDSLASACAVSDPTAGSPVLSSSASTTTSYVINDGSHIAPGYYYLKISMNECCNSISFSVQGGTLECPQVPCENCIGSFAPEPGTKYLISVWAKESGAPPAKTSYDKPGIYISFTGSATTYGPYYPSGEIIDGWQRIEEEFTVPTGATAIQMKLQCDSGDCYFDDIRVYPFDGSFKTYVYDPVTLRLAAELDERNFATIYEYDEEGKLLRVKKETERGVMTIQESKTSINKR